MAWGWSKMLKRGSLFVSFGLVFIIGYMQLNPVLNLRWYLFPVFSIAFVFWFHVMSERAAFSKAREGLIAVVTAVVLLGLAQVEIELPSYTKARQVREAVTFPFRARNANYDNTGVCSSYGSILPGSSSEEYPLVRCS